MNREDKALVNKYIWIMVNDINSLNEYFPVTHNNLADLSSGRFGAIIVPRVNANDFVYYEDGDWIRIAMTYKQISESTSINNIGVYDREYRRTLSYKEADFLDGYHWVIDKISTFPNDVERNILKFHKYSRVIDWYSRKYMANNIPKRGLCTIDNVDSVKREIANRDVSNNETDRVGLARRGVAGYIKVQFKEIEVE